MKGSKTRAALWLLLSLTALGLVFSACGEETVCDKARAIEKRFCQDYKDCFPCVCVLKGKDYVLSFRPPPFHLQVDIANSYCMPPRSCEGNVLLWAEACMEYENQCNPCFHPDAEIIMCENPAFPELCGEPWWD
jgi:hypothetical protein